MKATKSLLNLGCAVVAAALIGGCCDRHAPKKPVPVERPDRTEIIFAAPDVRTIPLDSAAEIRDTPFALAWDGGWERPWTFIVSFDYRTAGVTGDAVALRLQPLKDDGSRAPTWLWPNTFTGKREDTYVLGESADFRRVSVGVDLPNVIRKSYRCEWQRRFGHTSGKVEVKNFEIRLVRHALHAIRGGEYEIRQTKYFRLKNVFFADSGTVTVDFAYPKQKPDCRVDVKDVKGRIVRTVEGRDGRATVDFPTRGYWALEATADYPDGTRITTPGRVAVCGTPIAKELVKNSRYGIMVVLGTPDLWEKLGSRWDQRFFAPDNLKVNFRMPNETADAIFTFHSSPVPRALRRPADRNRQGEFPPEDWDAYRAYVGKFMDAQPDMLKRNLCLTGELDFQWRGTDEEYVKMCRIFCEEARKRNPNVFLTGPDASRIKLPYFRRLHKLGYFDLIDGINVHHYVDGTKPEGEYWEDFVALFDFLKEAKIDKPVYMTETGWTTGKGNYFVPVSYENQARYLTRGMDRRLHGAGVDAAAGRLPREAAGRAEDRLHGRSAGAGRQVRRDGRARAGGDVERPRVRADAAHRLCARCGLHPRSRGEGRAARAAPFARTARGGRRADVRVRRRQDGRVAGERHLDELQGAQLRRVFRRAAGGRQERGLPPQLLDSRHEEVRVRRRERARERAARERRDEILGLDPVGEPRLGRAAEGGREDRLRGGALFVRRRRGEDEPPLRRHRRSARPDALRRHRAEVSMV